MDPPVQYLLKGAHHMSLIVLGTVALDHVKTPSGAKKDLLGGSAAHFSMSAAVYAGSPCCGRGP